MRSNATSAVSARPRLPDAPLWRADRRSGRLCSGADDAHELRLDGVGHHLAPQAELVEHAAPKPAIYRVARGGVEPPTP